MAYHALKIMSFLFICSLFQSVWAMDRKALMSAAKTLVTQQQFQQAYILLEPLSDEYAGDAEFDYLYGSILVKLKQNTLAVLALERALIMRPEHLETQQLLLKTYQQLNNFDMAQQLANKMQPTNTVNTNQLGASKEQNYHFSGFLGIAAGYDSNLTTGPNHDFITLPVVSELGDVYVGDSFAKDQDFLNSFSGGGQLYIKLPQNFALNLGVYGNHRLNSRRHDEDMSLVSSWLSSSYQWQKQTISLTFKQRAIWLSEQHYQDQYTLLGQWSRALFQSSLLSFYADGRLLRYRNAQNLNAHAYRLGAIFYQQFGGFLTPLISTELYGGENKLHDTEYQYLGYANIGGRLGAQLNLTKNTRLYMGTDFEYRHYKQDNPFFLTVRDDKRYGINTRYSYYFFNKQLDASLQWYWQLNESSLALYDYQRHFVTLSLQWNF